LASATCGAGAVVAPPLELVYRLRKDRSLKTTSDCKHRYTDAKAHTICVKVIDVFGCDTSILLEVAGAGGLRSQSVTSKQRSGK